MIKIQNDTTDRIETFPTMIEETISEAKLELEERIKVIEEANMVIEKPRQRHNSKDLTPYEDIKFETEEETEQFISETNKKNIKIKMEIPSAPEEEPEYLEEEE